MVSFIETLAAEVSGKTFENLDIKSEISRVSIGVARSFKARLRIAEHSEELLKRAIKGQTRLLIGSSLVSSSDLERGILNVPVIGAIGYIAAMLLIY